VRAEPPRPPDSATVRCLLQASGLAGCRGNQFLRWRLAVVEDRPITRIALPFDRPRAGGAEPGRRRAGQQWCGLSRLRSHGGGAGGAIGLGGAGADCCALGVCSLLRPAGRIGWFGGRWRPGTGGGQGVRLRQSRFRALVRAAAPEAVPSTSRERRSSCGRRSLLTAPPWESSTRSTVILAGDAFVRLGAIAVVESSASAGPVHPRESR